MSSLPGGAAGKLGNRYEDWWTLYRLADVLSGKADEMRLEPPGPAGAGIEFWVDEPGGERWCEQVKDASARGSWTLHRLTTEGVLPSVAGHLADGHNVRLVLSTAATDLSDLSSRARNTASPAEYSTVLTREQRAGFTYLAQSWGVDYATAWQYLRRVHVEHHPPEQLRRLLHATYSSLVQTDPDVVVNELRGWLYDMLHQIVTARAAWAHLEAKGLTRRLPPARRPRRWWRWAAAGVALVLTGGVAVAVLAPTDEATVPLVEGLSPEDACAALEDAGLECAPADNEATTEINVVHGQNHDAGAVVPKGTAVRYTYGSTAPVPLRRFQAPAPGEADFISPTMPGPPGWQEEPFLGSVYRAGQTELSHRLVTIYQFHCTPGVCKENPVYWLKAGAETRNESWILDGEAFRCFDSAAPPDGTQPLFTLRHPETYARRWMLPDSPEYDEAVRLGFKNDSDKPLCHIWAP